ncbi:MAG: hypothetical protein PVF37_02655 [Desulfobacterales bacterium]|jgi:hypothetical protein
MTALPQKNGIITSDDGMKLFLLGHSMRVLKDLESWVEKQMASSSGKGKLNTD